MTEAEATLSDALQDAEIASVDAARESLASRKDLEVQLKVATAALATQLGDYRTLADLGDAAASATRRFEALKATIHSTTEEQARQQTDLEGAEARLAEMVPAEEKTFQTFDQQLDQLRTAERQATQAGQDATQVANERRSRPRTLETQIVDLTARYSEGLEGTKTAAQFTFAQAEARVTATQAELPLEFEKLPERNKRAAVALQQLANELQTRRAERDQAKGTLETLGGLGLYSRETQLEEKQAEAILRRDTA